MAMFTATGSGRTRDQAISSALATANDMLREAERRAKADGVAVSYQITNIQRHAAGDDVNGWDGEVKFDLIPVT